jgi:hypothetical protein
VKHLIATCVVIAACSSRDGEVIEPGILEHHHDPARIEAPPRAAIGEPIRVGVTTYGDGCASLERTEASATEAGADVFPLDRRQVSDKASCPLILHELLHEVTLTFDTPGTKSIQIHGRRVAVDLDEAIAISISIAVAVE